MTTQLEILLDKIKVLETELIEELQKQEEEFSYEIKKRRVFFEENVIIRHKDRRCQNLSLQRRETFGVILRWKINSARPSSRFNKTVVFFRQ